MTETQKATHLQRLHKQADYEKQLIEDGAVLKLLAQKKYPISDIAIAATLEISIPSVRAELQKLIKQKQIGVTQPQEAGLGFPGLVYWKRKK